MAYLDIEYVIGVRYTFLMDSRLEILWSMARADQGSVYRDEKGFPRASAISLDAVSLSERLIDIKTVFQGILKPRQFILSPDSLFLVKTKLKYGECQCAPLLESRENKINI